MTFQLEFIFLFISYFIKRILSKSFVKSGEFEKIYIRGNGHIGGEGGGGGGGGYKGASFLFADFDYLLNKKDCI